MSRPVVTFYFILNYCGPVEPRYRLLSVDCTSQDKEHVPSIIGRGKYRIAMVT